MHSIVINLNLKQLIYSISNKQELFIKRFEYTNLHRRSYVGAWGLKPPNFTGCITEGKFEHKGINTYVEISGNYKRKIKTLKILINSLIFT